jgi:uncharacterized membrane protein YuzA (DUF378 family)
MRIISIIALILVIIGAINWGIVGLFGLDFISGLLGPGTWLTRGLFILVGLAGLWSLSFFAHVNCRPRHHK